MTTTIPPADLVPDEASACVHLGRTPCHGIMRSGVAGVLPVYPCRVFGLATLRTRHPDAAGCCAGCGRYECCRRPGDDVPAPDWRTTGRVPLCVYLGPVVKRESCLCPMRNTYTCGKGRPDCRPDTECQACPEYEPDE